MDIDKMMRQVSKLVSEKQDDILFGVKGTIEQQYCPIHGKFAEFEHAEGKLGDPSGVRLSFSYCCEDLKIRVDQAIAAIGDR